MDINQKYEDYKKSLESSKPLRNEYIKLEVENLNSIIERLDSLGIKIYDSGSPDFYVTGFNYDDEWDNAIEVDMDEV